MKDQYSDRIVRLIQLYLVGNITGEEQRELEEWCDASKKNRCFLEQICREELFSEERFVYRQIDDVKALRIFEEQIKIGSRRSIRRWWKYAAVLLLPLLIGGIWKWKSLEKEVSVVVQIPAEIRPGSQQAVLVLDDGQRVALKEKGEGEILVDERVRATKGKDRLVYAQGIPESDEIVRFNELEVPRGGEYKVTLSHGSLVYLNSVTRIKYPVVFSRKERKVFLSGEAYFEVAEDPKRPFLVEVGGIEVKVYGTFFNINSLREGGVQTVLVKGSVGVKVLASGEESMIEPGQMAEFRQGSMKVEVKEVDVNLYTDWKNGIFRFKNQRLEDILTILSNWYDVDIFYTNEQLKELHFTGHVKRYEKIDNILRAIKSAVGVTFAVEGKEIWISK